MVRLFVGLLAGWVLIAACNCGGSNDRPPNLVLIFTDDLGYGDLGLMGHPTIRTPHLHRMADEGVVMTQFYSASSVCSPSRAALLTGRYPIRNGVVSVFFPQDTLGMPRTEILLAELLKEQGYATGAIGKWHLGHQPDFLPTRRGFDRFYGLLYSNDMVPVELYRNEEVIEFPVDQDTLTKRYTEEAIAFVESSGSSRFSSICLTPCLIRLWECPARFAGARGAASTAT